MTDTTYKALVAQLEALQKREAASGEDLKKHADEVAEVARRAGQIAEQISAKNVDNATVGETHDLSRTLADMSTAAHGFAARTDDVTAAAKAAAEQARTTHNGIHEAFAASGVDGIYDVDRSWFAQE